jgi:hypothetical protein
MMYEDGLNDDDDEMMIARPSSRFSVRLTAVHTRVRACVRACVRVHTIPVGTGAAVCVFVCD